MWFFSNVIEWKIFLTKFLKPYILHFIMYFQTMRHFLLPFYHLNVSVNKMCIHLSSRTSFWDYFMLHSYEFPIFWSKTKLFKWKTYLKILLFFAIFWKIWGEGRKAPAYFYPSAMTKISAYSENDKFVYSSLKNLVTKQYLMYVYR